ncbi:MAG: 1-deoxy-D-xylulose-5-phosphate reductoisomerase [Bacteroidales bacterium]|nr:1-deoxy-D-xylulose-5-phosphate reductoisomerase [Bacteroidales bacterium]
MRKRVAILGSTGSIGTQALEVISKHPEIFEVTIITARSNVELLISQALEFIPKHVVISNENEFHAVYDALSALPIKVHGGDNALSQVVRIDEVDIVLTALVGFAGLIPTLNALKAKKDVALANKETLVVAGELITEEARRNSRKIYPVDSEHSAIFQCLAGETGNEVEKIYLTASGGPFRGMTIDELKKVNKKKALMHPNWCMGNKVTIDSASLMNKGLEAIEARWLFNLMPDQIKVIVHPQSIIHSIVQFTDGSMKAQMGLPDMRLPIQYALGYPYRLKSDFPRFDFTDYPELTFEKPDTKVFRNLVLAFNALEKAGNMPCIMNAANEIAVEAFLSDKLDFIQIPEIIEKVMERSHFVVHPTLEDYTKSDKQARDIALSLI